MASQKINFYRGTILNPHSDTKCDYFADGLLVVKGKKIKDVMAYSQGQKKYAKKMSAKNTTDLGHAVILPGFYDMHFHWVQDDVREMPKDSLLEWLDNYTFPAEMKYSDKTFAKKKAKTFFKKLSATGTVGGACYSSIHEGALDAAMDEAVGDFVIGNVLMNMNSPKKLTQSEKESIQLVKKLIKKHKHRYCLTPRFAISTSPIVMKAGSKMADEAKCFKQTHLSETKNEIEFVMSLYKAFPGFENVESYTDIYQRTGMLGKRSLMGHGIHLGEKELKTLAKSQTSIIHCPTSNAPIKERGLGSGLFDFKKIEKAKVKWALGSDIGGGPHLSMFDVMRSFVDQNKLKKVSGATYVKALFRSSLAGAKILGVSQKSGNLDRKKFATFIVIPRPTRVPKSAEELLKQVMAPLKEKREHYGHLVFKTCYKGEFIFNKK